MNSNSGDDWKKKSWIAMSIANQHYQEHTVAKSFPSIKTKAKGGADFKPVPAGVHFAICTQVIDLGIQKGAYKGTEKFQQKVYIKFEIPSERVTYKKGDEEIEGPATVGRTFTNSIGEKSHLRPLLEAWRGKTFTAEEEAEFELTSVLGKTCQVSIVHEENNGKTYANINSIIGLSTEQKAAMKADKKKGKPEGELIAYSTEFHDAQVFDSLPNWLQEKIRARVDEEPDQVDTKDTATATVEDFDDDIPF